jgi:hypothetical protein
VLRPDELWHTTRPNTRVPPKASASFFPLRSLASRSDLIPAMRCPAVALLASSGFRLQSARGLLQAFDRVTYWESKAFFHVLSFGKLTPHARSRAENIRRRTWEKTSIKKVVALSLSRELKKTAAGLLFGLYHMYREYLLAQLLPSQIAGWFFDGSTIAPLVVVCMPGSSYLPFPWQVIILLTNPGATFTYYVFYLSQPCLGAHVRFQL